jgi:hypothetical protein
MRAMDLTMIDIAFIIAGGNGQDSNDRAVFVNYKQDLAR